MTGIVIGIIAIVGLSLILAVVAKVSSIFKSVSPLIEAISDADFDGIEAEYATTPKSVLLSTVMPSAAVSSASTLAKRAEASLP